MNTDPFRKLAGLLAASPLFAAARPLWHENQQNWNLPLSKLQKLLVGSYLILQDYHDGLFPRRDRSRAEVYAGELDYHEVLPGMSPEDVATSELRKPWWFGSPARKYLEDFRRLIGAFERRGIAPPQKILELGCGGGWMAEALALMGFQVVATTINPRDIATAQQRVAGIAARGISARLAFQTAPMESVADVVHADAPFDAVFVFEALHHSADWREALASAQQCLRAGGWLFVMNEPAVVHTLIAYRVARLSRTHEIGFRPGQVVRHLRQTGFDRVDYVQNRCHFFLRPFSLAAQKRGDTRSAEPLLLSAVAKAPAGLA
ncbi:class I SAM-dependent methyltransferase [bacterium]|nr:class I SAM-dependent methyltransferase [bacterium]